MDTVYHMTACEVGNIPETLKGSTTTRHIVDFVNKSVEYGRVHGTQKGEQKFQQTRAGSTTVEEMITPCSHKNMTSHTCTIFTTIANRITKQFPNLMGISGYFEPAKPR